MNRSVAMGLWVALVFTLRAPARAQTPDVSFEPRFAAASTGAGELAPLPTVGIAPSELWISAGLADVLAGAVNDELSRASDGSQFQVLLRSDGNRVRWVLATVTEPRNHYLSLVSSFASELLACLHTLGDDSIELSTTILLISGAPLPDAAARQAVTRATGQMLHEWKNFKCGVARNASPLLERQRTRIVAATQGMLTGQFDSVLFRGQNLIDLIAQLGLLFFDRGGLWAVNREARLVSLLQSAWASSFLAAETSKTLVDMEFPSFWSWILAAGRLQPSLTESFIDTVAGACAPSLERMRAQFRLRSCVDSRALTMTSLHVAGMTVFAAEPGGAP